MLDSLKDIKSWILFFTHRLLGQYLHGGILYWIHGLKPAQSLFKHILIFLIHFGTGLPRLLPSVFPGITYHEVPESISMYIRCLSTLIQFFFASSSLAVELIVWFHFTLPDTSQSVGLIRLTYFIYKHFINILLKKSSISYIVHLKSTYLYVHLPSVGWFRFFKCK